MAANTPRRKRFTAEQRRAAAIPWLPTYSGKSVVNGYSRWFGVDRICALGDLMQIGAVFDEKYVEQLRLSEKTRISQKHKARALRNKKLEKGIDVDVITSSGIQISWVTLLTIPVLE